jgi:hypothetical protein
MVLVILDFFEHFDDELRDRDCPLDTCLLRTVLAVVGLRHQSVKALVVEIYARRLDLAENTGHRSVVHIEEAQRSLVAGLALLLGHAQHVVEVEDVGIKVHAVHAVSFV